MPAITQAGIQICAMPCLDAPRAITVPAPGSNASTFAFHRDGDRELYLVMPRNHPTHPSPTFNPKIMLVGLSPARTQIEGFLGEYRRTGDYDAAARWAAFRGLEDDIVGMLRGLGAERFLGLSLENVKTFAGHPDILTNSLVKCASLKEGGSSDDFDPTLYPSNVRCITHRFLAETTNPQFTRLSHIFVFGDKAQRALKAIRVAGGHSAWESLGEEGRRVVGFPHPSGQNGEYVALAKLPHREFPSQDSYAETMWREYAARPPRRGRAKQGDTEYKAKRRSYWGKVAKLRALFS